jgi:uncharacterized DUF497 family protein
MLDRFEWDPVKARLNLRIHGVSFEDAAEALADPDGMPVYDSRGILLVVFTDRQMDRISRIISARRATRKEEATYHA